MDLNDPRRRLQVAQASSPSLRLAAAPKQTLSIAQAKPQQTLQVAHIQQPALKVAQAPSPQQLSIASPAPNTPKPLAVANPEQPAQTPQQLHGWSAIASVIKSIPRQIADYNIFGGRKIVQDATEQLNQAKDFVDTGYDVKKTNQLAADRASKLQSQPNPQAPPDSIGAKLGEIVGGAVSPSVVTSAVDLKGRLGIAAARQPGANLSVDDLNKLQADRAWQVKSGLISQEQANADMAKHWQDFHNNQKSVSAAEQKTGIKDVAKGDFKKQAEVALEVADVFGGAAGAAHAPEGVLKAAKAGDNIVSGVAKIFTPKPNDAGGVVKDIIKETNPEVIQKALNVDPVVAQHLASETSPEAVKAVLQEMSVDPNIQLPDAVRARLQDEGITAVNQKDNPYGAEYNPGDNSIDVKDQSFATAPDLYHEMGHSIYATKMSPEEKALFDNYSGPASKEALGRPGYTKNDLVSEDVADMISKASTGRIEEVPEQFRDVIAKYAGTPEGQKIAQAATDTSQKLIPAVNDTTKALPSNVGDNFVMADKGTPGLPKINKRLDEINKQFRDIQLGKKAATREEISSLSREQEDLITKAQTPFADQYKAVDKANGVDLPPEDIQAIKDAGGVVPEEIAQGVGKTQTGTSTIDESTVLGQDSKIRTPGRQFVADEAGNTEKTASNAPESDFRENVDSTPTSEAPSPQKASDVFPNADTETQKAIQDVMDNLDPAERQFNKAQDLRSSEKAGRINQAAGNFDAAGGGEAGFRAKLSALRGKYSESGYTPIAVNPETEHTLLNAVENSGLRDFEKLNTQNALRKVWGANPAKPTAGDVNSIRTFFNKQFGEGVGEEIAKGLEDAAKDGQSYEDVVANIAGLPRALMATGDLSGGFRQALPLGTRHPGIWANANKESVKYALNPKYYESEMKKIADSDTYPVIADKLGVDLTGVGAMQDEAFIGAGYAEKIPVAGIGVKAADRAYTGVITRMRYDVANKMIKDAGGADQYVKNMQDLYGDASVKKGLLGTKRTNKADRAMRAYGEVINTLTGRGGMKGGLLDEHMKTASTVLFAPRLWAANLQRLNPVWYGRLYRDNPQAAKLAAQSAGTFYAMAGTVLGLAAAAGAEVGLDPRSADFAKIKLGNTRYDILGGQQQNAVLLSRLITGEKTNSATGETKKLGDGFGSKTALDVVGDTLQNKANPLLGFGIQLMQTKDGKDGNPILREDQFGNEYNVADKVARLGIPLGLQGAFDTSQDVGDPVKGTIMNAPSFFGVGVQTYGNTPTKDQGQVDPKTNKPTFKGKVTDDMVKQSDGTPFLDDKGAPVKVKFSANATDVQKQAQLEKAKNTQLTAQAKSLLSKDDANLFAKGQANADSLSNDQLKKFNEIKKWVSDYGKEQPKHRELSTDQAKNFYSKWDSMTKDDQKGWLSQSPDDNAKSIATELNKQRRDGLDEYKPSNELSKAYAEYEKDINSHPDYSEIDKRNKAKAFQVFAYKLNTTSNQRDLYNEGGSADTRELADEGKISKEDLDAAMKLDEDLYKSGLTGTLKFSKKFRNDFGYSIPSGGGSASGGRGGRGGSGGSDSKNAHLSDLLISSSVGKASAPPKFSEKRRTQGAINFKVNLPSKSSSKKVSINL